MKDKRPEYESSRELCHDLTLLSSSYIDNELPRDLKYKFKAHLLECPSCRKLIEDLKQVVSIASTMELAIPKSTHEKLMETLHKEYGKTTATKTGT